MIKLLKILSVAIAFFLLLAVYFLVFFYFFPTVDIRWFIPSVIVIYFIGHFLYDGHENSKWKKKLAGIALSRPYLSKADYVQIVKGRGYEINDIEACYDIIDSYMPRAQNFNFSIYPEDDIFRLYRVDDEDLADDIEKVFKIQAWPSKIETDALNVKYNNIFNIYYLLDVIQMARELQK